MQHLYTNGTQIHQQALTNQSKNRCRKMDPPKSIKIDPWWFKGRSKAKGRSSTGVHGRGSGPREGGRGEGNPSQRDWKQRMSLNHLSQEGWWDYWKHWILCNSSTYRIIDRSGQKSEQGKTLMYWILVQASVERNRYILIKWTICNPGVHTIEHWDETAVFQAAMHGNIKSTLQHVQYLFRWFDRNSFSDAIAELKCWCNVWRKCSLLRSPSVSNGQHNVSRATM